MRKIDRSKLETRNEVNPEVASTELRQKETVLHHDSQHKNRKKADKPGKLPEKLFLPRNSLLTDLFETNHGRSVYNIFVAILIILFIKSAIVGFRAGKLNLGMDLILWNFGKFHIAFLVWLFMISATIAVYGVYSFWACQRARLITNSMGVGVWDYFWLGILIVYQCCFFYYPAKFVISAKLPPVSALITLTEQVRLIMKTHAFVRTNAPHTLSFKPPGIAETLGGPKFSEFLYFLFCPSLVYRDSYPRTKSIRWKFVAYNFLEVIGIVFFVCFLVEQFLIPSHSDYNLKPATHDHRIVIVFQAMLPSMLAYMLLFYCTIHSWMNAWGEMLRFADKMFYQDWWNVYSYGAFYRRWNIVVHDWLYLYIYKDIYEIFCPKQRFVPTMVVFAVSSIIHEYIFALTFGFFLPMMLLTFGLFGSSLVFITSDKFKGGNLLVWLLLGTGTGFMASFYTMEWYSRVNCIQTQENNVLDFFIPRSLTCVPIHAS